MTLNTLELNGTEYTLGATQVAQDDAPDVEPPYKYPEYTSNNIDDSGSLTTGTYNVSEFLPVVPGEALCLSSALTIKVAFYAQDKSFVSMTAVSTGINTYTVPGSAAYARFVNLTSGGGAKPLLVREKEQPKNKTFTDLIYSPLKSSPSINVCGDSNTYGYGLSDRTSEAWSYMLFDEIANIDSVKHDATSPWCEAIGMQAYSSGLKAVNNSRLSTWTDASSITLVYGQSYSGAWNWYVDGVLQSGASTTDSITLDGLAVHKVTVVFTGGQVTYPGFSVTKHITYTNSASSGTSSTNFVIESGHDWIFCMIGTNNRAVNVMSLRNAFYEYFERGTFIVPFPNHKTDSTYTYSELQTYSNLRRVFEEYGFSVIDCSNIAGALFYDSTYYQSDLIHFNALGHRMIANIVGGAIGFPVYLKSQ